MKDNKAPTVPGLWWVRDCVRGPAPVIVDVFGGGGWLKVRALGGVYSLPLGDYVARASPEWLAPVFGPELCGALLEWGRLVLDNRATGAYASDLEYMAVFDGVLSALRSELAALAVPGVETYNPIVGGS